MKLNKDDRKTELDGPCPMKNSVYVIGFWALHVCCKLATLASLDCSSVATHVFLVSLGQYTLVERIPNITRDEIGLLDTASTLADIMLLPSPS